MIMEIYNSKGILESVNTDENFIVDCFAEYMFLKYIRKAKYRMTTKYNYKGSYDITFKDMLNNYKIVFKNFNTDSIWR